jgi:hypothetical protein
MLINKWHSVERFSGRVFYSRHFFTSALVSAGWFQKRSISFWDNRSNLQLTGLLIYETYGIGTCQPRIMLLKTKEISDILLSASVVGFSIPDTSLPQYINIAYQILQMTLHIVLMTSKSIKWHFELNYGYLTPFLTTFQFYTVLVDET